MEKLLPNIASFKRMKMYDFIPNNGLAQKVTLFRLFVRSSWSQGERAKKQSKAVAAAEYSTRLLPAYYKVCTVHCTPIPALLLPR